MADLVVSIDGDSKGLVGSLQKADGAMGEMREEARKLTDQLREVADDADKAAGELINKLGGPGAIKAIAGVGIAFEAVKTGVETFIDSSERMFQSYGDQGRQMWDKVEESLRGVSGAFAEVSLGSGDLADKAARLQTMGEGVKSVWSAMLAPVGSLIDQFSQMAINVAGLTTREQELAAQYRNTTTAITEQANAYQVASQMMADAEVIAMGLLGMDKQREEAAHRATQEKLIEARQTMQNTIVEREFAKTIAETNDYWGNAAELIGKAGLQLDAFSDIDTQAVKVMRASNLTNNEKQSIITSLKIAYERVTPAIEDYDAAMEFATDSERESLDLVTKAAFQDKARPAQIGAVTRAVKENTDALADNLAKQVPVLTGWADWLRRHYREYADVTAQEGDKLNEMFASMAHPESIGEVIGNIPLIGDAWIAATDAAGAATDDFKARWTASNDEIKDANANALQAQQDATKATVEANVKQYGRLAAAVVNGEMSMADAARSAIGNIIMALGDSYAVKAGAAAIETPWLAAKYAAAATIAYTAGAYLGATDKGQGDRSNKSDTPATETAPAQATNVTYALRVDAAFADGESIARRFAQMQAAAQSRGLVGAIGAA